MNLEIKEIQDLAEKLQERVRALIIENESLMERVKMMEDQLSKVVYNTVSSTQEIISALAKQEQHILKVVESVIKEHFIFGGYHNDGTRLIIMCNCENEFSRKDYIEHLLQEIKKCYWKGERWLLKLND